MKTPNPITKMNEPPMNAKRRESKNPFVFIRVHSRLPILLCLAGLACSGSALGVDYSNEVAVADYVKPMLYWPDSDPADRDIAAFRYKVLLYTDDGTGIRADTANMGTLYGAVERTRAQTAENELRIGLTNNPSSLLLQNLLLDIHYDRMAAELVLAGRMLPKATRIRMGLEPPSVPTGLVIDDEINLHQQALEAYHSALEGVFSLLADDLDLTNSPPAGYTLFKNLVPTRELEPATYLGGTNAVSVTGSTTPLFDGYKDLVLLFNGLRDYGRVADAMGRLKTTRNNAGDLEETKALVSDAQRFLFLQQIKLLGIFPELDLGDAGNVAAASGLTEAAKGVAASLASLETLAQSIRSESSLLGFGEDFLMLVQKQDLILFSKMASSPSAEHGKKVL